MSRLGLVCLILVLLGLGAESYIAAKLGLRRGEVEDQLRKAIADTETATTGLAKAKVELGDSQQKLQSVKVGWGYEWNFPAGGNAGSVQVVQGRLAVNGLGTSNGLTRRQITDASGQARELAPVVHVFTDNGQGGSRYIGEFSADISPNGLNETTCVLIPTWAASPEEQQTWNFAGAVRMRSQTPAGERSAVEHLHQTIQLTYSQITQTGLRTEEQKRLTTAAEEALQARKNELLGDSAAAENPDHPEYKLGLVQTLVDVEEERNAVQFAVDELRRQLKVASEFRTQQLDALKQIAAKLSSPETKVSQRTK
jgi:hypothetical protein